MKNSLDQLIHSAIQAFQGGDFNTAESSLVKALRIDSNCLPALHILGLIKASQNQHENAAEFLKKAVELNPADPSLQYNLAKALAEAGLDEESLEHHKKTVELMPNNKEAHLNYGTSLLRVGRHEEANSAYEQALTIDSDYCDAWQNRGIALFNLERYHEALSSYEEALRRKPEVVEVWCNVGKVFHKLRQFTEALASYERALKIEPNYAAAWYNKGITYSEIKRYDDASAAYSQAISIDPENHDARYRYGLVLCELGRYQDALACYDRLIASKENHPQIWHSASYAYCRLKLYKEALISCDCAIELKPEYPEAWCTKGVVLNELKRYEKALACFEKAIEYKDDLHEAWSNQGISLAELERHEEAVGSFERTFELKPDSDYILNRLIQSKQVIGDWSNQSSSIKLLEEKIGAGEKAALPFSNFAVIDSEALHLKAAKIWVADTMQGAPPSLPIVKNSHRKIRIGYFSSDFRTHPIGLLMAELFKTHNRDHFEIIAFSLEPAKPGDKVRENLKIAFDQFIDVENKSDPEICALSRDLEIDIAVDLNGFTSGHRTDIFAYRAAPIQVNYLGYPGTMGADFIDYIIADKIVIPQSSQIFYSEKIAYLPNSYMVDDSSRQASSKEFKRSDFDLPEHGVVFCCFNNSYKFNERILAGWANILSKVSNSVLWISENNELFRKNILREFAKLNINKDRIIFAGRLDSLEDHLARYRLADLFLDTQPFNAHTTAVDALKSGVPVLTLLGKTFAGRVAASLLNAIELPELITTTQEEYEALAIDLGNNPAKLRNLKERLKKNTSTTPLFNTQLFTKNIEAAYSKMYDRYQADLPPEHFYI